MAERGFPCSNGSCAHTTHGQCHLPGCPLADKAEDLLYELTQTVPSDEDGIKRLQQKAKRFLDKDKSFVPPVRAATP